MTKYNSEQLNTIQLFHSLSQLRLRRVGINSPSPPPSQMSHLKKKYKELDRSI